MTVTIKHNDIISIINNVCSYSDGRHVDASVDVNTYEGNSHHFDNVTHLHDDSEQDDMSLGYCLECNSMATEDCQHH